MTNQPKQVGNADAFVGGSCGLAVSNECFATSKKLVRTKTDERALAAGGAQ
jgi:hypothetical protein